MHPVRATIAAAVASVAVMLSVGCQSTQSEDVAFDATALPVSTAAVSTAAVSTAAVAVTDEGASSSGGPFEPHAMRLMSISLEDYRAGLESAFAMEGLVVTSREDGPDETVVTANGYSGVRVQVLLQRWTNELTHIALRADAPNMGTTLANVLVKLIEKESVTFAKARDS